MDHSVCKARCGFSGSEESSVRLGLFLGLVRIAENLLTDDALGSFVQVLFERTGDFQKLRPKRLIDERLGRTNQNGRVTLPRVPVGT